jgi:glycosyltransferase 2 family protein
MPIQNLGQKIILSLLLGVVVLAAFTLYTDVQSLQETLRTFEWLWMLPVVGLTFVNLGLRYVKWEYYLRLLGIRGVKQSDSIAIFLANYLLILTPGKVGALLKSYFLKQTNGIPVARTMPIIVAERLSDGLGMVLMTAIAMVAYPAALPAVILVVVGMGMVVLVAQHRPLALRLIAIAEGIPFIHRFAATLHTLYDSTNELLQIRPLIVATLLGTGARATEGVALYFVLLGLGVANTPEVLTNALFITALSNIVGVLVMMPGGLGGTEGSMAGLITYFIGLAPAPTTAATLLARLASFWLPALLGGIAIFAKRAVFFKPDVEEEAGYSLVPSSPSNTP